MFSHTMLFRCRLGEKEQNSQGIIGMTTGWHQTVTSKLTCTSALFHWESLNRKLLTELSELVFF